MPEMAFRLCGQEAVRLCEHITLPDVQRASNVEDRMCEYWEDFAIRCEVCNKTHSVRLLVG